MTALRRIAVVAGETPAARVVAGAVTSLLTAVGRAVERVAPGDDLDAYAAVVLPRAHGWRVLRERAARPVLVVDADLLSSRVDPAFRRLLGAPPAACLAVGDTIAVLPRALPPLSGPALGEVPPGLAAEVEPGLGYVLPVVVTPALRTVAGFWNLARVLEDAVAALIGEERVLYADPWPRGFRSARVLTFDLDGLERRPLPPEAEDGRRATLFCCADVLGRLGTPAAGCEIAAHGDVHRSFDDPAHNLARVDRMLAAFHAAGIVPRGFSPPNSTYSSPLEPLLDRFGYVRIGYQERVLGFYPERVGKGLVASVSYYPDFLHRYVGAVEYARLVTRFCAWAEATGVLAVPCFHPCLWSEPLHHFLDRPSGTAWEATLAEVMDWWAHRHRALAAVAERGEGAAPPDLALARETPAARLAALRPADGQPAPGAARRSVSRVVVAGRDVRVVPAADGPAAAVEVPLGGGWQAVGWLPGRLRRATGRALLRIANKSGLHACLYGDLGVTPEVRSRSLRLPVVAADEPVMLTRLAADDLRRMAGDVVRRFIRTAPHA